MAMSVSIVSLFEVPGLCVPDALAPLNFAKSLSQVFDQIEW
jgi:hypothetical protein